jgi:phosphoglycolate phosphatase
VKKGKAFAPGMAIRLIIFDLDGTLINAYPAIVMSFRHTMRTLGYPQQAPSVICRAVGWGDGNLLRPFVEERDLPEALRIYRRHHAKALLRHASLFPRARALLRQLKKRGFALAVASNRPTRFSHIVLRHLHIVPFFDCILCADKLKHRKPHPEIIRKILYRLDVRPRETIYVGDMAIDAQAGRRAGVKSIMVTTGSSSRQELRREKPYRIVRGVADILPVILSMGKMKVIPQG